MSTIGITGVEAGNSVIRSRVGRRLAQVAASVGVIALCPPALAQSQAPVRPSPDSGAREVARQDAPAGAEQAGNGAGLDEIIVTAQKRAQSLQDVPVAVTALTTQALVANRITNVRDLDSAVPNLSIRTQGGANGAPLYTLRGVLAAGTSAGSDKGVALYVDGVFLGSTYGSIFELAEIERIEVLRGPQGTLFGRNSTAGAISITTPEPSGGFGIKQTVSVGNYDQLRSVTRLNTPAWGPFSASLAYTHSERRGDIRNLGAGTVWDFTNAFNGKKTTYTSPKYLGDNNLEAIQAAFKFDPGSNFTAIDRFDYTTSVFSGTGQGTLYESGLIKGLLATQPNPAAIAPISPTRPEAVNNWATVPSHIKNWGNSLTASLKASNSLTLKNIAAYRQSEFFSPWAQFDSIGGIVNTGGPLFAAVLGPALAASTIGAPLLIQATTTGGVDKQFSDEFQANYDSRFVTLTAGALYYNQWQKRATAGVEAGIGRARSGSFRVYPGFAVPFAGQLSGGGGRTTRITIRSYAAYGQGEFHITSKLDAVGGIRYTNDKKTGTDRTLTNGSNPGLIFPLTYHDDEITYSLGVNYKINRDILAYGKYSTGYISGGSLAGIVYEPEKAKSWEGGVKAEVLDRRVRVNLAVFSVKYSGLQTGVNGALLTPPNPLITQALVNVGDARAKGVELETTVTPLSGLVFSGGLGYTHFEYTRLSPLLTIGQAEFRADKRPKWTANVSGQYETPVSGDISLLARVDGNWRSRQFDAAAIANVSASFPAADQDLYKQVSTINAYWIVNGRLALQGFRISGAKAAVALWARNLFDNKSVNLSNTIVTTIVADYERARTFGVDLSVQF